MTVASILAKSFFSCDSPSVTVCGEQHPHQQAHPFVESNEQHRHIHPIQYPYNNFFAHPYSTALSPQIWTA